MCVEQCRYGLNDYMTGKNRFQRQKSLKILIKENHDLAEIPQVGSSNSEEIVSTSLLCVCSAINMFLTHHLQPN